MRGLTNTERLVYQGIRTELVNARPTRSELNAMVDLEKRGLLAVGPDVCPHCGNHLAVRITSLGDHVEYLDKLARGELPL